MERTFDTIFLHVTTVGMVISLEDGAKNGLWAATVEKGKIENGGWYEPVGKKGRDTKFITDVKLAEELWEWTEKELAAWM